LKVRERERERERERAREREGEEIKRGWRKLRKEGLKICVLLTLTSTVVKVLCYKSEGRWFDPRLWISGFFIDIKFFRSHYGPGVDSASNRYEYQEYFLGVKVAGA